MALQPSDIRGFDGLKGTKIPHRKGKRKQKEEMEETEFHGVCVSCIGAGTLHQLTPCGPLFGLNLLACLLKFSIATEWQREENREKLNDIQTAGNTHTHVYQHAYIHVHTCTHKHSYTHAYSHTLIQPHTCTLMCIYTKM